MDMSDGKTHSDDLLKINLLVCLIVCNTWLTKKQSDRGNKKAEGELLQVLVFLCLTGPTLICTLSVTDLCALVIKPTCSQKVRKYHSVQLLMQLTLFRLNVRWGDVRLWRWPTMLCCWPHNIVVVHFWASRNSTITKRSLVLLLN